MKDLIKECLEYEEYKLDIEELANELFHNELNYNNADPTSHQTCYTHCEIVIMIEEEMTPEARADEIIDNITTDHSLHIIREALEKYFEGK